MVQDVEKVDPILNSVLNKELHKVLFLLKLFIYFLFFHIIILWLNNINYFKFVYRLEEEYLLELEIKK